MPKNREEQKRIKNEKYKSWKVINKIKNNERKYKLDRAATYKNA